MTLRDKLVAKRKMFITQYGKEPNAVILGQDAYNSATVEFPQRYVGSGVEILGMRIIRDCNKANRVEVGDFKF